MNAITKDPSRLAWLAAVLSDQRHRLAGLLQRLSGLGQPGAMKASVFRKFLGLLDQVATTKDQETGLINRIEDIEAQHRWHRRNKKLKCANDEPQPQKEQNLEFECNHPSDHPNRLLWWVFVLSFIARRRMYQKKQGLTAD